MKVNEVLTEAGVMDTLKALAQQGLLSGVNNIRQTANRLANQRDVQQLANQMTKVWNNVVSQERTRLQGAGSDGTIGERQYKELLANFVSKNVVGRDLNTIQSSDTKQEISNIIQRIQDNRESPRAFSELFRQMIIMGLIARMEGGSQQQQQPPGNQQSTTSQPPPRSVNAVIDAFKDAGIREADLAQLKAAISSISGIQPIRTQDTTARALLQALGIPTS